MNDVTQILGRIEAGDPTAANELLPMVYEELRKLAAHRLANERPDHTLQATALVHEAYLRLVGTDRPWQSRGHFFAAAARSMQQILVNWAHARNAQKRGAGGRRQELDDVSLSMAEDPDAILDLQDALEKLGDEDREASEIVRLRLFAGLSVTDAGQALGLSRSAAYESWQFARAWFASRRAEFDSRSA